MSTTRPAGRGHHAGRGCWTRLNQVFALEGLAESMHGSFMQRGSETSHSRAVTEAEIESEDGEQIEGQNGSC